MTLPSSSLNVALCQMTSTDDPAANEAQVMDFLNHLGAPEELDLIAFPENSLYMRISEKSPESSFKLDEPIFKRLAEFADINGVHILLGSVPLADDNGRSNATIWLRPGETPEAVYRKIHLFDVEIKGQTAVRESEQFIHGRHPRIIEIAGWRLGLSICYDLRFPELFLEYVRQGAHALFVPSAFLVPTGRAHWHVLLRARAIEAQSFVLAPAQSGEHVGYAGGTRHTYGHSLIVNPWGEISAEAHQAENVIQAHLDPEKLQKTRGQVPMAEHRRLTMGSLRRQ